MAPARGAVPDTLENGAEGSRTLDLLHAMQTLSQLSYGPGIHNPILRHLFDSSLLRVSSRLVQALMVGATTLVLP